MSEVSGFAGELERQQDSPSGGAMETAAHASPAEGVFCLQHEGNGKHWKSTASPEASSSCRALLTQGGRVELWLLLHKQGLGGLVRMLLSFPQLNRN